MRKIIFSLMAICLTAICFTSCKKHKNVDPIDADTVVVAQLNVENLVSTDKEYMFLNYRSDYRYFETSITLKDFMDEECDGAIEQVANVFQDVVLYEKSADVTVVFITHTEESTDIEAPKGGIWVGDEPINDFKMITFKEAFDLLMSSNYPKPHSRQVVLRKEVGPKEANPQYIFGNEKKQLYVDAVTGAVSDVNPAFGE